MKKLFEIEENEKKRILEMHERATKNLYLSEQGSPELQQPARTGTQINGKTYTIENIRDAASLNKFINWGLLPSNPDSTSDTRIYSSKMANQIGFAYEGNIPDREFAEVDSDAVKRIKRVYSDLDTIAQNYNIGDLCNGRKKSNVNLQTEYSFNIAKNRAVSLGWCAVTSSSSSTNEPKQTTPSKSAQKREAAKLAQDRQKF